MPRTKKPVPLAMAQRAAALRARRELDEVEEMRFVMEAVTQGLSQGDVAEAIGASQATISRIVKRVTQDPKALRTSVKEIVNRATVKEITRPKPSRSLSSLSTRASLTSGAIELGGAPSSGSHGAVGT